MYKLTGVKKDYQKGRDVVARAAGRRPGDRGRRMARHPGPDRPRQVHAAADAGRAGPADGSGSIQFGDRVGEDLAQMRESQVTKVRAESIGFIFQTFNLVPTLSAQENVETALVPLRVPARRAAPGQRRQRWRTSASPTGPGTCRRSCPAASSSGSRSPGRWSRSRRVLLADEPTGNLDEGTRDEIIGLLEKLWRDHRLTMVLVTHDSTIARRAQRLGVMQNGKLSIKQDTRAGPARTPAVSRRQPDRLGARWTGVRNTAAAARTRRPCRRPRAWHPSAAPAG